MRGVVSFSHDPATGVSITDAWAQDVRKMGFAFVRTPLTTTADGVLPGARFAQAFARYRAAGLGVRVVLSPGFLYTQLPGTDFYPNMPRNLTGDRLNSPWIDHWSLRAAAVLRRLPGVEAVYVWNEPNELALLAPGVRVPPGEKGGALAPDVAAALSWQAARRIKHYRPDLKVFCGCFSLLPQAGLDAANPYLGRYITAFYQTFAHMGPPWPWDGISLNMEGWWTAQHAADAIGTVRALMAQHGDTGILTCGEWGVNNAGLDPAKAAETFAALQTALGDEGAFFQDPALVPSLILQGYRSYGLRLWRQDNDSASFEALGDLPWRRVLPPLLGGV